MGKFNKHLIVVGSARSGTSWLSETLSQPFRYRMLFEPEHETRTKKGYLLCDQWITDKDQAPEAHAYLKQVFANRVDCDWIAQNSNRKFKMHLWPYVPKRYIIKFVRANLLGSYMQEQFGIPVIHVIRNPYDVLYSQEQVKFPWLYNLDRFLSQPKLIDVIKTTFDFDIRQYKTLTNLEILCLRWCIENVIPLEVLVSSSEKVHLIRYEDLNNDIELFMDLCSRFRLTPAKSIETIYAKPSTKTHPLRHTLDRTAENKKWGSSEINTINQILAVFKTQLYSQVNNT